MPFRDVETQLSCTVCPELTREVCPICDAPACESHRQDGFCVRCHALLLERLEAEGLTLDDLVFRPVPTSVLTLAGQGEWNRHTERGYRARFVLASVRNRRT